MHRDQSSSLFIDSDSDDESEGKGTANSSAEAVHSDGYLTTERFTEFSDLKVSGDA